MGAERSVFGILAEHAAGHRDAPDLLADAGPAPTGVILVNGGNNHRAGINRNYTQWARAWAGEGVSVLRLDIRGLGDSPPARARDLNVLYRAETAGDVIAAMDWLERHRGIRRFVLAGGETSGAAAQSLGLSRLDIGAEISPGVPWTFSRVMGEDIAITLKSGNFGDGDFFATALARLEE